MADEEPRPGDQSRTTVRGDDVVAGPGETIGNYRVLQRLGQGGMGIVYEAEQFRPVRRRVALKVIKLGMDTEAVVRRFESERQALALMNHPNIARVYDAGATEDGRPFFAMEHVQGTAITEYCASNRLDLHERLLIYIGVCEGVQHAHQKGIIHRDLKPSNVLVRDQDGKHVPKIIDFGVAKATAHRLTDRTYATELGQLVGTPEYMSPEQAEMSGLDVDTRTDVYQLGVMLYELLTGTLPFDPRELRQTGLNEYRRRVLHEEPQTPSQRVAALDAETVRRTAHERRMDAPALRRALRGDLDWIVMRALEKDRTRRYASASELGADLRRHLAHEPILASPPSNLYRVKKFVQRHRTGVTFSAILIALLAGLAVTMTINARLLAQARDKAEREAEAAREVSDYLVELFKNSDPSETLGESVTAREILDRGAQRIEAYAGQPLFQARMQHTMGEVYSSAGFPHEAARLLEQALAIRKLQLGEKNLETAATMNLLAGVLVGIGQTARARELYERALAVREELLGEDSLDVAASLNALGSCYGILGDNARSAELQERALHIRERLLSPDHPDLAPSLVNRAKRLRESGDYAAARPLLERALEIIRHATSAGHPDVAMYLTYVADLDEAQGDIPAAIERQQQALEIRKSVFVPDHPRVAESLLSLAILELRAGRPERAAALHDQVLAITTPQGLIEDNPAMTYREAEYRALAGERERALALLRRAMVDRSFGDAGAARRDENLASLRDAPEFASILAAADSRKR